MSDEAIERETIIRKNVAYHVLNHIVKELSEVKETFETQYKEQMANPWALDLLTHYMTRVNPSEISDNEKSGLDTLFDRTEQMKIDVKDAVIKYFGIPKLKSVIGGGDNELGTTRKEQVEKAIDDVCDILGALEYRVHMETKALLDGSNGHTKASELVEDRFNKVNPFRTREGYESYLDGYLASMKSFLDYFHEISKIGKDIPKTWTGRRVYNPVKKLIKKEIGKLGIEAEPNLEELPVDTKLIANELFGMYELKEYKLMGQRTANP
ncbi:hypothetical protein COT47_08475 [Candidatus Woesearchaeota archaeon CG08_land_8_20_14_0_20_43_7]|nr:MAG: hypothetical protein COT47_08475 [Candidatus Woesearchaeota archaeon CG08_land_8_20_14_0_20_43_7]